jgi:hypothetical protein
VPTLPPTALSTVLERAREMFDKLPTRWLITSVAAILLLLSGVLGGLDDAPVEPIPVLEAGETAPGDQFSVAVTRALLIDALPEQGITPEKGNRLLVIGATVENQRTMPVRLATDPVKPDTVVPVGVEGIASTTPAMAVVVVDDGTQLSPLQPGVPTDVVYVWEIMADALAADDELRVDILDRTVQGRGIITYGDRFSAPFVIASVDLTLGDVGAGVDVENGDTE